MGDFYAAENLQHVAYECGEDWKGQILKCTLNWIEVRTDTVINTMLINMVSFIIHLCLLVVIEALRPFKDNPKLRYQLDTWLRFPRILRHWLLCVCVLNIFYLQGIASVHPFMVSLLFISLDTALFLIIGRFTNDTAEYSGFERRNASKIAKTTSRHQGFSSPLEESFLFFITQICLMIFFVSYMNDNASVKDLAYNSEINLSRWIVGFLLSVTACKSKAGKGYNEGLWSAVWTRVPSFPPQMDEGRWIPATVNLRMRQFFDIVTNGFFYQAIICIVPVLVVTTEPQKFIGSLVGFMFVVKLDESPAIDVDKELDAFIEQGGARNEPDVAEKGSSEAPLITVDSKTS